MINISDRHTQNYGYRYNNDDKSDRWDKASVHEFRGTYGDYLLGKVSKVFPELRQTVLESAE